MNSPTVSLERVLEQTGWARAVAYALVHDRDLSEDLVQEVVLRAIRTPPRSGESVRAWIRAVLRNLAVSEWRARTARGAREVAVGDRDPVPSAAEIQERLDLHQHVTRAVASLDPDLSEVVYLRYYEGLRPQEIADRLGIAVLTVHRRLARAHDALRRRLGAQAGREGMTLAAFLGPLVAGLPDPGAIVGPTLGSGASSSARRAWRAFRAAAVVTAVVSALLFVALWLVEGPGGAVPVDPGAQPADVAGLVAPNAGTVSGRAAPAGGGGSRDLPRPSAEAPDAVSGAPLPAPPRRPFTVRLPGLPADGSVRFSWTPAFADRSVDPGTVRTVESRDGALVLDLDGLGTPGNPLRDVDLVPDDPRFLPVLVRVPVLGSGAVSIDFPVSLQPAASVTGRVLPSVPGRAVHVGSYSFVGRAPGGVPVDSATAADDGTFRVRVVPGETQWIVVVAADQAPFAKQVTTSDSLDLGTIPLGAGATVSGRVRFPAGPVSAGPAYVSIRAPAYPARFAAVGDTIVGLDGDRADLASVRADVGRDGSFRIGGLPPGPRKLAPRGFDLAGDLLDAADVVVDLPAADVDLGVPGSPIDVRIPAAARGARLLLVEQEAPPSSSVAIAGDVVRVYGAPATRYSFSLVVPPGERWIGEAEPGEPGRSRSVTLRREVAPSADAPTAEVEILVPADSGVRGLHVEVFPVRDGRLVRPAVLRDHVPVVGGVARLAVKASGTHRMLAVPWASSSAHVDYFTDWSTEIRLSSGAVHTMPLEPRIGGRLRLLTTSSDGRPESGTVRVLRGDEEVRAAVLDRTRGSRPLVKESFQAVGTTEIVPALPPGEYTIEVRSHDGRTARTRATVVAGEEVLVECRLP